MNCPNCGKNHRKGLALNRCEAESTWALGHLIIRGLKETDPRMIQAREAVKRWEAYRVTIK